MKRNILDASALQQFFERHENERPPEDNRSASALISKHRTAIVKMRERGWTWNQIVDAMQSQGITVKLSLLRAATQKKRRVKNGTPINDVSSYPNQQRPNPPPLDEQRTTREVSAKRPPVPMSKVEPTAVGQVAPEAHKR